MWPLSLLPALPLVKWHLTWRSHLRGLQGAATHLFGYLAQGLHVRFRHDGGEQALQGRQSNTRERVRECTTTSKDGSAVHWLTVSLHRWNWIMHGGGLGMGEDHKVYNITLCESLRE